MTVLLRAPGGGARPQSRGFTLAELVMTLVIISVLAVFAVSRMDFVSGFDERAYHDRLKAGLEFARKAAVAMRRYVCVTSASGYVEFKFNPNTVETVSVGTLPGSCSSDLALPSPDTSCSVSGNRRICPPPAVTVTGSGFYFDARGGASAGVTFSSTGQPNITVEPDTGYVH